MEAADREQVGEPGPAHRLGVGFGDAVLVAGGERGGDAALRPVAERIADMRGEPGAQIGEPGRPASTRRRRDDREVERAPAAADALEPGGPGEIVAARRGRRRRRHQPGAHPHRRAGGKAGRSARLVDIDAQARRQRRVIRRDEEAQRAFGGERLNAFDARRECRDMLALDSGRRDPLGLGPDQAAAHRRGEREDRRRATPACTRRGGEKPAGRAQRKREESEPGRAVRQREPGGDAGDEADRKPQGELVALGIGEGLEALGKAAGERAWSRRARYARAAGVTGRHGGHPWRNAA